VPSSPVHRRASALSNADPLAKRGYDLILGPRRVAAEGPFRPLDERERTVA